MGTAATIVDLINRGMLERDSPLAVIGGKLADGAPLTPQDEELLKGTLPPLIDRLEEAWGGDD